MMGLIHDDSRAQVQPCLRQAFRIHICVHAVVARCSERRKLQVSYPTMRHFCRFGGALQPCGRRYSAFVRRTASKGKKPSVLRRHRLFSNTPDSEGRIQL